MATTCKLTKGTNAPIETTAEMLEKLSVALSTEKPCTRNVYTPATTESEAANDTPALKACEWLVVKHGAIIGKDATRKEDVFTLHCDAETGASPKSGYDVSLTRSAVLAYAKKVIAWAKSAPGNPGVTYVRVNGRRATSAKPGEILDNE